MRVAAADVQADLDVQTLDGPVERRGSPHRFFGKRCPRRLVELDELAPGAHHFPHFLVENIGPGEGQMAVGRVKIRTLVVREFGQHVRPDASHFHFHLRRSDLTRHPPVVSQPEARVPDRVDHCRYVDPKACCSVAAVFHLVE